ncbi:MAG TPA: tetratricopeptide repeat protein [Bryobacteraceae bacterium]
MDRVAVLKQLVEKNPANSFARYGLAMEYGKSGKFEEALAQYRAITAATPDYHAAYFQGGRLLEQLGRVEEAKQFYRQGIEVTTRLGEGHAREELQAALDQLS